MLAGSFVNQIVILAFVGLLAAAALEDVRRYVIPNRFCLAIALLFPAHALAATEAVDWAGAALVGGASLVVGFVFYSQRWLGAGDAKLFAATALWAGPQLITVHILVTAIVGGLIALALWLQRRLSAPAARRPAAELPARVRAAAQVLLGNALLAWSRAGGGAAAVSTPAQTTNADGATPVSPKSRAADVPYGAAIAAGGLVVAAVLLMRG